MGLTSGAQVENPGLLRGEMDHPRGAGRQKGEVLVIRGLHEPHHQWLGGGAGDPPDPDTAVLGGASEMGNPTRGAAVAAVAEAIVAQELAELAPGSFPYGILVSCDGGPCLGFGTPTLVRVHITLFMEDIFFANYTQMNLQLAADVTYPYLGR